MKSGRYDWRYFFPRLYLVDLLLLKQALDEGHREALEKARAGPPPCIVEAYLAVWDHFPPGWPPEA